MFTALAMAFASLFVPLVAFLVVAQSVDLARWVRRKGWREPKSRIDESARHASG